MPVSRTTAAVTQVWGGGDRVGIRISPGTTTPGETPLDSNPMATYGAYLDALSGFGLVYVHDIEGVTQMSRDADGIDYPALRQRFKGAYIANNNYTLELANETIAGGKADLISFGRPFIANPDLVERLRHGAPLAEAPKRYWYGGGATGYSDWPGMTGVFKLDA